MSTSSPTRSRIEGAVVIPALLALAAGCGPRDDGAGAASSDARKEAPRPGRRITVVASGDTRGFIVPCGCASRQLGGIPRRATAIEGVEDGEVIYLDAGGGAARTFEYDRLKLGYIWRGIEGIGVDAANLGASEVALGREFLADAARGKVPFVSANVAGEEDGKPVVPPWRTVEAAGARVTIIGVTSRASRPGPGLRVLDPEAALRAEVPALREKAGVLVCLADGPEEELVALAEAFPELDLVLTSGQSQPIAPRLIAGRTVLAGAGVKGKFLAVVPFSPGEGGSADSWLPGEGRIIELADTIPDHPRMTALVKEYQEALRTAALTPEKTGEAAALLASLPGAFRFAGSGACAACHALEMEVWKGSKHAHGLETLEAKGFEADPYCIRCHTTGYGGPGGYRTRAEAASHGGIGCESCHGPSAAHVESPRTRTPVRASDACVSCHDAENSPAFAYAEYWPRIVHGKGQRPGPEGGKGHASGASGE
jgi:hypothetical protein